MKIDDIRTEQEFKKCLLECAKYMTKIGKSESVEMEVMNVLIELKIKIIDKNEE